MLTQANELLNHSVRIAADLLQLPLFSITRCTYNHAIIIYLRQLMNICFLLMVAFLIYGASPGGRPLTFR